MSTALTAPEERPAESPIARLVAQKTEIQQAMTAVMKSGEHYGVIPGTEKTDKTGRDVSKPSLFQPGADTLCFLFRLRPEYTILTNVERDDLISYDVKCTLIHIPTGDVWGEGLGAANTREKRYSSQSTAKVCPQCSKPAIIKGKADFGGGWVCWRNKGGCGAKFLDGDQAVESQEGQVQSGSVWDLKNTILKMAAKRSKVAAVLTATAASDCFTQDLEDLLDQAPSYTPPRAPAKASPPAPSEVLPSDDMNLPDPAPAKPKHPPVPKPEQMFDTPERVGLVHNIKVIMLKHPPEGLGMHPKRAANWLKKYFGVEMPLKLPLPQAKDAALLLQARMKDEAQYRVLLEQMWSEKRVLSAEVET